MTPAELDAARAALRRDLTIDIVTLGRRSGEQRTTEIWFMVVDDLVYICGTPGAGDTEREYWPRDWLANLVATPDFSFVLKESVDLALPARATPVTDAEERRRVFSSPVTGWYRDQTGSVDALVERAPIVRIEFAGPAAALNGTF
ncbi:MAG: nitroreductase/quinone reductase family protein [Actinomycetota bacterium]